MTAPTTSTSSTPAPVVTQTHTWAYVGLTAFASILSAFAPKIQAAASAHPLATILIGGTASVLGSALPGLLPSAPK